MSQMMACRAERRSSLSSAREDYPAERFGGVQAKPHSHAKVIGSAQGCASDVLMERCYGELSKYLATVEYSPSFSSSFSQIHSCKNQNTHIPLSTTCYIP
jgi:hypothetical protein